MSIVELAEAVLAQHANGKRCKICRSGNTIGTECKQKRMAQRYLANADRSTTEASMGSQNGSTVRP